MIRTKKTIAGFQIACFALLIPLAGFLPLWIANTTRFLPLLKPFWWPWLCLLGACSGFLFPVIFKRIGFFESIVVCCVFAALCIFQKGLLIQEFADATSVLHWILWVGFSSLILWTGLILGGIVGYLFIKNGRWSLSFTYESWLGNRFLMSNKQGREAISLITTISIASVCIGTMGMVIVMSIMNGFGDDVRKKIVGSNAHLILMRADGSFSNYNTIIKKTKNISGILGASPFILSEVMLSSDVNLTGTFLKSIDLNTVGKVIDLPSNIQDGNLSWLAQTEKIPKNIQRRGIKPSALSQEPISDPLQLPGIVIGKEMAKNLKVFVGDQVNVINPIGELGPTGPIPKTRAFRVAAIFYTGMYEYDSKLAYILLSEGQRFFNLNNSVHGIEYRTHNIDQVASIAKLVQKKVQGYPFYTQDWMQMNYSLFSALKLEKIAMFLILIVIVAMASLLILVALVLVVIEKGKEIAILKSMGATDSSIMAIFITYGLSIGLTGAFLGTSLGIFACLLIQRFGIELDPSVYYINYLPIRLEWTEIGFMCLGALLISFLSTIPPSLFAARLRPVEGLRQ